MLPGKIKSESIKPNAAIPAYLPLAWQQSRCAGRGTNARKGRMKGI